MLRQTMETPLPAASWVRLQCGHAALDGLAPVQECRDCDLRLRPVGLVPTRTTPPWTVATVPPALLSSHHTSAWAELRVRAGTVVFSEDAGWSTTARPGRPVTIVPGRAHAIAPSDDAVFDIRFYGAPGDR